MSVRRLRRGQSADRGRTREPHSGDLLPGHVDQPGRASTEPWPATHSLGSRSRAALLLAGFAGLTLPLMPVQALLKRLSRRAARRFPHWYHRRVCRLLGIRVIVDGRVASDRPVLLVANHTSWLDIPVLSAVAPVSFVAKKEVSRWPGVSWLANLQRTVYVDRTRRLEVSATAGEIARRLSEGDAIVLFAEGTSTDGNRVLPFRSSLFAAALPRGTAAAGTESGSGREPVVQTLSIAYTRLCGIPLGRADRPLVGWYGDMEMASHAWGLLKSGPLDVVVSVGPPVSIAAYGDRKTLAARTEQEVRAAVTALLRDPGWRRRDEPDGERAS